MSKNGLAILCSVWLGLQVGSGYLAVPVLFRHLEKFQAGKIAGELFSWVAYSGLAVWVLMLCWLLCFSVIQKNSLRRAIVAVLLVLLTLNQFMLSPVIEALKTGRTNWLLSMLGGSFAMWHGVSGGVYLLESLLGLWAVVLLVQLKD